MAESDIDLIKPGKYIVIQRQSYTKLCKFGSVDTKVNLGKVGGLLYSFKMCTLKWLNFFSGNN